MRKTFSRKSYDDYCPGNGLNLKMESHFWDRPSRLGIPFFAESALIAQRRGGVVFMHHHYPMCALELIVSGELTYLIEGEKIRAETGDIFLLHHDSNSGFRNSPEGYYEKRVLILAGSMRDALLESLGLRTVTRLHPQEIQPIRSRMESIITLLREKKDGTEFELASQSCALLFALAAEYRKGIFHGPENLRRTLSHIESLLQEPLGMEDLSQFCGVSPATLLRMFQKYLQCTPMEYLLKKRMEKAKNLLRMTELPIKEVAVRCGYPDQLYFSTVFRKHTGEAPREFRKDETNSGNDREQSGHEKSP